MGDGPAVRDRAVYLAAADAVVLADLHLGRDATSGIAFDLGERTSTPVRVRALLDAFAPAELVLAGDVLHDFRRVPEPAAETLDALEAVAGRAGVDLVTVEGNHDTRLDAVADPVAEYRLADGTVVCHGHDAPDAAADRYVVGHDHPAIVIEGRRRPCVLLGEGVYRGSDVVALPAFSEFSVGTAVNTLDPGDLASPLLRDLDAFRPLVRDDTADETLAFPPLGVLRDHL